MWVWWQYQHIFYFHFVYLFSDGKKIWSAINNARELHHLILYFLNKCSAPALKFQKCISLVHRVASHTSSNILAQKTIIFFVNERKIPQHVNILFRSWRENIVYQVACIMYTFIHSVSMERYRKRVVRYSSSWSLAYTYTCTICTIG